MQDELSVSRIRDDDNPLLRDVAFNRHSMNKQRHISPLDGGRADVGVDNIRVDLIQGIDEQAFQRTAGMAVRATIGIDPDAPPNELPWEEMLKGGLQTALESQTVVFGVSGVSRTCTHQLVRSRRAAFHQQSQRASFMGDHPNVRMPESISRKPEVREAYLLAFEVAQRAYRMACNADVSYQDARFVLPEGTETYIMCEYPLREFLNMYAYRACSMFQWEICHTVREMGKALTDAHPWLKPYVKITCEKTGVCEFQGWESVEGQCDFPQAREENRRYKPDPKLRIGG